MLHAMMGYDLQVNLTDCAGCAAALFPHNFMYMYMCTRMRSVSNTGHLPVTGVLVFTNKIFSLSRIS